MFGAYWPLICSKGMVSYRSLPDRYEINQADMEESISTLPKFISALLKSISALSNLRVSNTNHEANPCQTFC